MTTTIPLATRVHKFDDKTWEERRERLDAEYAPYTDDKGRKVHGWACISETPAHMLGLTLVSKHGMRWMIGSKPFTVELVATRDGKGFGALPRRTSYATREEALAHARSALVAQGKRYAKKFGAK